MIALLAAPVEAQGKRCGDPVAIGDPEEREDQAGATLEASIHRELELLTRSGMTAEQALASATSVPARTFGMEKRPSSSPVTQNE